uniref:C2H2-type domain-containing protein n=2 Tax=Cacopsylla melanoneura TaxID=428564 RepID=A0A8D9DVC8_9HEMI
MTYMCPYCYHEQKESTLCAKCNFDLKSNHFNPVCSKCKIKFISMEELKVHFSFCNPEEDQNLQNVFGKCESCNKTFYSEAMYNIHLAEFHQKQDVKDHPNLNAKDKRFNTEKRNESESDSCDSIASPECPPNKKYKTTDGIEEESFRCERCKSKFANKSSKNKHIRDNACSNEKYAKCYFENCNVRCLRRRELNTHIRECHGVDLKYEIKKFPTFNDFELWKDEFGMNTLTFYSIMARTKDKTQSSLVESITYGCSFDFHRAQCIKSKTKKRISRFDVYSSSVCTSRIYVKIFADMKVLAKYCAQHNHPLSPENLKVQKLPKSRRDFLMNAFVMGASVEEVMNIFKEESTEMNTVTKEFSLSRRFLKEIQRKSLLKYSVGNDTHAVKQFVQDLMTNDGVLVYKSGVESFGVSEELSEDVFMLGIQTEQMLNMLETYGNVIYIEGLRSLTQYPDYRLFNFLVSDEENNVFPVAYFITNALTPEYLSIMFSVLKPRVEHINVESLVVQSEQYLEVALTNVFNNKTIFINQWDLSGLDEQKKKVRGIKNFDYVVIENKDEDIKDEDLHLLTGQTVSTADDCVLQFHQDMRFKFKHSHSMFILLNELILYFKKRYSSKFNLSEEENVMHRILKQMRKQLFEFEYKVEDASTGDWDEDDVSDEETMVAVSENCDNTQQHESDEIDESLYIDDIEDYSQEDETMSALNITDDRAILKEIIVSNRADTNAQDDSTILVIKEYQTSILNLLESNPLARSLVIKTVLNDTKALYEQVQACCNETTEIEWKPKRK